MADMFREYKPVFNNIRCKLCFYDKKFIRNLLYSLIATHIKIPLLELLIPKIFDVS